MLLPIINNNFLMSQELPILQCLKCNSCPFVKLIQGDEPTVEIACLCAETRKIALNEYISELEKNFESIKTESNNKSKCEFLNEHKETEESTIFCYQCQKWLCEKCHASHKRNIALLGHTFIPFKITSQIHCEKHPKKYLEFYCITCKIHFCTDCLEEHKTHSHVKLCDYFSKNTFKSICDNKTKAKEIIETNKKLRDSIIVYLEHKIKEIKEAFSRFNLVNEQIISFIDIMTNTYQLAGLNYQIMNNLNNYSSFNFQVPTFKPETEMSCQKLDGLIEFYKKEFVIGNKTEKVKQQFFARRETRGMTANEKRTDAIAMFSTFNDNNDAKKDGQKKGNSSKPEESGKMNEALHKIEDIGDGLKQLLGIKKKDIKVNKCDQILGDI